MPHLIKTLYCCCFVPVFLYRVHQPTPCSCYSLHCPSFENIYTPCAGLWKSFLKENDHGGDHSEGCCLSESMALFYSLKKNLNYEGERGGKRSRKRK